MNIFYIMNINQLIKGIIIGIAKIIPGLSATSTLMSIGLFKPLMDSVSLTYWKSNPAILAVYALLAVGFLLGLFFLSKLMNKVIEKFKLGKIGLPYKPCFETNKMKVQK